MSELNRESIHKLTQPLFSALWGGFESRGDLITRKLAGIAGDLGSLRRFDLPLLRLFFRPCHACQSGAIGAPLATWFFQTQETAKRNLSPDFPWQAQDSGMRCVQVGQLPKKALAFTCE